MILFFLIQVVLLHLSVIKTFARASHSHLLKTLISVHVFIWCCLSICHFYMCPYVICSRWCFTCRTSCFVDCARSKQKCCVTQPTAHKIGSWRVKKPKMTNRIWLHILHIRSDTGMKIIICWWAHQDSPFVLKHQSLQIRFPSAGDSCRTPTTNSS